jgi:hypothetical protein
MDADEAIRILSDFQMLPYWDEEVRGWNSFALHLMKFRHYANRFRNSEIADYIYQAEQEIRGPDNPPRFYRGPRATLIANAQYVTYILAEYRSA